MDAWRDWLPDWFNAGGLIMWPILGCSVVTVVVFLEKLWTLRGRAVLQPDVARVVKLRAAAGETVEAGRHCAENPGPYSTIAEAAMLAAPFGREEVRQAVLDAGRQEEARLERHLPLLRTVASVAPLLGLLGTVLGMIRVFRVISQTGLGQAAQLSAGIEQALLTTAFGLAVAIPSLLVFEGFRSRVERLLLVMERELIDLLSTLRDRGVEEEDGSGGENVGRATAAEAD